MLLEELPMLLLEEPPLEEPPLEEPPLEEPPRMVPVDAPGLSSS
jgi:hypothetical protein